MTDADGHPTIAAIITAFTEADFDRVPEIVLGGPEEGLAARTLLDDGLVAGIQEVGEMRIGPGVQRPALLRLMFVTRQAAA